MVSKWDYGGAYKDFDINNNSIITVDDNNFLKVHDIFKQLPNFMHNADMIFTDSPWNLGNLNTFYTKADIEHICFNYEAFYKRLFECIHDINPRVCYLEIGKQYLAEFIMEMKKKYKYVTFYNSSYYHNKDRICYVVRGANKARSPKLDYMDEEDIIKWICANEDYDCIGDLCMGRGLVGYNAYINNKKFVGTELNYKRLAVLLERIKKFNNNVNIKIGI